MTRRWIPAMAIVLVVAGCTPADTTFGGAVRTDYALQVIDPEASSRPAPPATTSGEHAAAAMERYRKGAVKAPVPIQTTMATGGSSSGGGTR